MTIIFAHRNHVSACVWQNIDSIENIYVRRGLTGIEFKY